MPPTTQTTSHNQYKTQTLAPLRLSQDHFTQSKTNTLGGHYNSKQQPQPLVHQNHHHAHEANNNKNYNNGGDSHKSPPDSPPELPIRNGLINNYNHNLQTNCRNPKAIQAKHYH